MRILFLDQSGNLGGAELALLDLAEFYRDCCKVGLFQDGPFHDRLQQAEISVEVLTDHPIRVKKDSNLFSAAFGSLTALLPLVQKVACLSRDYDLIYANTQKAFVVSALASALSQRPLVYHLHDILSREHFSAVNLRVAVMFANRFAKLIIANSQATRTAFIKAGGNSALCEVVYNGFDPEQYSTQPEQVQKLRRTLNIAPEQFVVGHFSRLSPWKGQHVLIDAIAQSPANVVALLVGDALFGEDDYVQQLRQHVAQLGLQERVRFLGFRSDIPVLMALCDLIAHTSTAPEPFGRVIIEAMLCGTPIVAAKAGGAMELIEEGQTGWLTDPGQAKPLAAVIEACLSDPTEAGDVARTARHRSQQNFHLNVTHQKIADLIGF